MLVATTPMRPSRSLVPDALMVSETTPGPHSGSSASIMPCQSAECCGFARDCQTALPSNIQPSLQVERMVKTWLGNMLPDMQLGAMPNFDLLSLRASVRARY